MENLQYLLLEELYLRYSSRTGTSLNAFIRKIGKNPDDIEFTIDIKGLLKDLEERGLIVWHAEPMSSKGGGFPDSEQYKQRLGTLHENTNQTFDKIYVEAHLTYNKGYDYARDMFDRELIRKSTLSVNKWMKRLTFILAITAALTLLVQIKQCDISKKQMKNDLKDKELNSKDKNSKDTLNSCAQ